MSEKIVQRDVVELMRLVARNRFLKPTDIPRGELVATQTLISIVRNYPSELDTKGDK